MMAEAQVELTDTVSSGSHNSGVNKYGLAFDELREEEIQEVCQDRKTESKDKTDALCDVCFMHSLIDLSTNVAVYLCYLCEQYLCDKCFDGHKSHTYIKLVSGKSEKERRKRKFLGKMRNESERDREELFEREDVSMVERVNIKHKLDQSGCWIYGLCGLNNQWWAVSDYSNYCIKLLSIGSNNFQRYLRFGSRPWGVTEMMVKQEITEQGETPASDISISNQADLDKTCMLAVTLPYQCRILIIDITQNPAVKTKSIKTKKSCWSIDFSGDKLFTLCRVSRDGPWFVSVMFPDGVTIETIDTDLHIDWTHPFLAVCCGRVFITDPGNNRVLCMNDEGTVVSYDTIEGSRPYGISVDPDTYKVYICAGPHDELFRLDYNLERCESFVDLKSTNLLSPGPLCFYRDRLYVGHGLGSSHENLFGVLRVL